MQYEVAGDSTLSDYQKDYQEVADDSTFLSDEPIRCRSHVSSDRSAQFCVSDSSDRVALKSDRIRGGTA